jgi:limonene 1,2-monooxygenase
VIGTPDDLVKSIRRLFEISGGFGTVIGFAHDWANRENTLRSWDLVARYVIPEINGFLEGYRTSRQYVIDHRESFERAGQAIMSKIMANDRAAAALQETIRARTATTGGHTPDLEKEKGKVGKLGAAE